MCLDMENMYPKYVFSKIAFSVLIYLRFISIEDPNHHNKDLIDYVRFLGGLV